MSAGDKGLQKTLAFLMLRKNKGLQTNFACLLLQHNQGFEKALRFVVGGRQRFAHHLAFLMSDQDTEGREGKEHVGKFGAIEPLSSGLENTMVR